MSQADTHAGAFYALFLEAFANECEPNKAGLLPVWSDETSWTNFMLAPNEGFLARVAREWARRRLNQTCIERNEWHKFDLMLLVAEQGNEWWRCVPVVTIEHENGDGIHDEVWKLACWQSRLRCLSPIIRTTPRRWRSGVEQKRSSATFKALDLKKELSGCCSPRPAHGAVDSAGPAMNGRVQTGAPCPAPKARSPACACALRSRVSAGSRDTSPRCGGRCRCRAPSGFRRCGRRRGFPPESRCRSAT